MRFIICRTATACLVTAALAVLFCAPAEAAKTLRVASGLERPIYATSPPGDPRLFIVEQRGLILILENGLIRPTPFLDIDSLIPDVTDSSERGLLGLAFDPQYFQNGRFYVDYVDLGNNTEIARYQVFGDPDVADPGSAEILLTIAQPYTNHKGGQIAFSPHDGFLYVGMGDGGDAGDPGNRAQNPGVLLGKMLRLDVSGPSGYAVPPSNPFVGQAGARGEIWALGLRNPYRWSFDRLTGDLWIADVGQSSWEEIDFQPASSAGGQDYGWRLMEGDHCYNPPVNCDTGSPALTYPIYEYDHGQGCAITGGFAYRGAAIPSLDGAFFFADFCSYKIWTARTDGSGVTELVDRTAELAPGGGLSIQSISGFGEDAAGEIYILDRGLGTDGEIYKIVPDSVQTAAVSGGRESGLEFTGLGPDPFTKTLHLRLNQRLPGPLGLEILDVLGARVKRLDPGSAGLGVHEFEWDGSDSQGRPLPAGTYFVRASVGREFSVHRVHLLR